MLTKTSFADAGMSNSMRLFSALATISILISAMPLFADEEYTSFTTPFN